MWLPWKPGELNLIVRKKDVTCADKKNHKKDKMNEKQSRQVRSSSSQHQRVMSHGVHSGGGPVH